MIECIIFDYGGVIESRDNPYKKIATLLNKDEEYIKTTSLDLLYLSQIDKIEPEQFWKELGKRFFMEDYELKKIWMDSPKKKNFQMISLIKKLYDIGLQTCLLSNLANIYDYPKKYYFDEVILSNEVGFRKPDKEIFEYTLNTLKLPAKECLFIDDLVKNIIPAKENFGFNCILYQNFNNLIKDMLGIDFSANCRKLFKSTLLGEEYETME